MLRHNLKVLGSLMHLPNVSFVYHMNGIPMILLTIKHVLHVPPLLANRLDFEQMRLPGMYYVTLFIAFHNR